MTVTYDDWVRHVFDHPLPPPVEDAVQLAHYDKLREASEKLSRGEVSYHDVEADMRTPTWEKWYFQDDAPYLQPEPKQTVDFITRAFNEIDVIAKGYSDAQVDQGLWYVLSNGCSDYMFDLIEDNVSLAERLAAVESFYTLYKNLYAEKCTSHLGHLSEKGNPLNTSCYMWWDIIPLYGKSGQFAQE